MTLTANVVPSTAGTVQFQDGTAQLGPPAAVNAGTASYTTTALALGLHSLSAVFIPSDPTSGGSASGSTGFQVTASSIAIDQTITQNGTGTVTTAPFATTGPRLLVAFIGSDGPATKQPTTVTGGGLVWIMIQRAN